MTTTTETEPIQPVRMTRLVTLGILAAIGASIVNALVRIAAITLFDVPAGFGPLGWGPVINTTIVGVGGATVVYGVLLRLTKQPNRLFLWATGAVLALSYVPLLKPPAFLVDAPGSVLMTLAVMHVTTAIVVIGILVRSGTTTGEVGQ